MDNEVQKIINQYFQGEEKETVIKELSSIKLSSVMNSEDNLRNTKLSILKLAKGDIKQVLELIESAKIDFRDVCFWYYEEMKNKN